jgi:hypothetical protein
VKSEVRINVGELVNVEMSWFEEFVVVIGPEADCRARPPVTQADG